MRICIKQRKQIMRERIKIILGGLNTAPPNDLLSLVGRYNRHDMRSPFYTLVLANVPDDRFQVEQPRSAAAEEALQKHLAARKPHYDQMAKHILLRWISSVRVEDKAAIRSPKAHRVAGHFNCDT
jgi:hypothetical protein